MHIMSDSKYAVEGITRWISKWEAQGWIGVANKELFQSAIAWLRARSAKTTLKWVKGHAGIAGNEAADELARVGAEKQQINCQLPAPPRQYLLRGARLASITQKLAYSGIREWTKYEERETTRRVTEQVIAMIAHQTKVEVTKERLWMSLKSKDIPRKQRDFLWKALHGAQKVGAFWRHIEGYEQRTQCIACGAEESMEHILTECEA
ncbi:ribonuclease H-like domain-containing protein, partial [Earliella scabrosa]